MQLLPFLFAISLLPSKDQHLGGFPPVGIESIQNRESSRLHFTSPADDWTHRDSLPAEWLARIPGGDYIMGDLFGDDSTDEIQHPVKISEFYMGKTEVTFEEYDAFCTATQREQPGDSGWGRGQHPVINIDWYDAVEYCNWLSSREKLNPAYMLDKTQKDSNNHSSVDTKKWMVTVNWTANGYRLPTEAEWEYAAREGGKKVRFGNGKDKGNPSQINFNGSLSFKKAYSVIGVYRRQTVTVEELPGTVNWLGLRHMSGNVYEWCQDWFDPEYRAEGIKSINPTGPDGGQYRALRGGGWGSDANDCRASYRCSGSPNMRFNSVGFRVVRHL